MLSAVTHDSTISLQPSFYNLFTHFFSVAFYSIWIMFTAPREIGSDRDGKPVLAAPGIDEYPLLVLKGFQVVSTSLSHVESVTDVFFL